MSKLWCYLIFLTWISYLLTSGLLTYVDGFFLSRIARPERSDCVFCDTPESCDARKGFDDTESTSKTCLKPRARVVLLVVDALKYEFLEWLDDSPGDYHRNKLPTVRDLLLERPTNSRLYKFVADPPTTTMQRLKALTTGTLPTFIDVGSNFASESVNEDNLIDQAAKRNGTVFMGDDTWTRLFPGKFLRQFPSPSFNVWDLDTVDREVRSRIAFELKKTDWSLLVAHTLGVDHCGHRHGQRHPEMARKLSETDELIKEVVEGLGDDCVLFVVGDHGMTDSGDHGGDSDDEVEAGMFVYSKIPLGGGDDDASGDVKRVNQIDLVPTLAAILGIPIPFSNIGTVITSSLPEARPIDPSGNNSWFAARSMWLNVVQAKRYIDVYSEDEFLFTDEKLQLINQMFDTLKKQVNHLENPETLNSFMIESQNFLKIIRNLCADIWVQFDAGLMSKGLIIVFCTLFFVYLLINGVPEERMNEIMKSPFLTFVVGSNFVTSLVIYILHKTNLIEEFKNTNFFVNGIVSVSLLAILVSQNWDSISTTWYNSVKKNNSLLPTRGILLLLFCGLFSNSYAIEEDKVLSFLLITMIAVLSYNSSDNENFMIDDKKSKITKIFINSKNYRKTIIFVGSMSCLAVRLSNYFWRCREEQKKMFCTNFSGKLESEIFDSTERFWLTGSLFVLALYITIVRIWLRNCGNLSGFSAMTTVTRYFPGIIVVCLGCYWVLRQLPKNARVKLAVSGQTNAIPIIVYFFIVSGIFVIFLRPLGIYLLPRKNDTIDIGPGDDVVPRLFDRVKQLFNARTKNNGDNDVPVVYGLGTIYSSAFISLSVFFTLLWSLLLGSFLAPGTFAMFVACTGVLGIVAVERFRNASNVAELMQIPSSAIFCWFLIAEYFFYGTGHQPTFSTVHWDAAFIGTGGHFYGNFLPAILIGMNTFGSHLIMALTLPLLAIVPFTIYVMVPELAKLKFRADDDMRKGELVLFERDSNFHNALFTIYGKYILFHGIRTFGCMLETTVHCRHLMVWKIFAPKLIFEGLSFLVSLGSVIVSGLMVMRIDGQVDDLISRVVTKTR